jgi:hypothetical protein
VSRHLTELTGSYTGLFLRKEVNDSKVWWKKVMNRFTHTESKWTNGPYKRVERLSTVERIKTRRELFNDNDAE